MPSYGIQRELTEEYPVTADKITVLANPVDIAKMQRPADFDRAGKRSELGYSETDVVLSFVALGHYERKGLPLIMQALLELKDKAPPLKLLVVGGEQDLIRSYRKKAAAMGLSDNQAKFVGMQQDVRPFLWAADAFVLPSGYEVFSLAVLEAAAAGLPLIVTMINGVEEFVRDDVNGIVVECSTAGVRAGLERLLTMTPASARHWDATVRTTCDGIRWKSSMLAGANLSKNLALLRLAADVADPGDRLRHDGANLRLHRHHPGEAVHRRSRAGLVPGTSLRRHRLVLHLRQAIAIRRAAAWVDDPVPAVRNLFADLRLPEPAGLRSAGATERRLQLLLALFDHRRVGGGAHRW